jgi:ring-1,2-phenylacetyl-CoA epoxidase subunit PaaE
VGQNHDERSGTISNRIILMSAFIPLTISSRIQETPNAVSLFFEVPADHHETFRFLAGQYLTVQVPTESGIVRRNYSISSAPGQPLRIGVKRVAGGIASTWLTTQATIGQEILVLPPLGKFTVTPNAANTHTYVLVAGGSGITPMMSIVQTLLQVEHSSTVVLVYGNTDATNVMYRNELKQLEQSFPQFTVVHCVEQSCDFSSFDAQLTGDTLFTALEDQSVDDRTAKFFVCGPPPMMRSVLSALELRNIPPANILREYFTIDSEHTQRDIPVQEQSTALDQPSDTTNSSVTVRLYGSEYTFVVQPDETILTAAQKANVDPPYACQIGACCTCRAKVLEGKVRMDEREALSDQEIEDGYVLTCQSHPLTPTVIVDYDL